MTDWKERIRALIKYILAFLGGAISDALRQELTKELAALIDMVRGALGA